MSDMQIFGLERLEDRTLLAVNVSQSGAKLTITGDDYDTAVFLFDDSGGIHVLIDYYGDGGIDFDYIYYGVENIKITMKGGTDVVGVGGISIEGSIAIDTGTGDDLVGFYYGPYYNEIDGNVTITTGDGDDQVAIAGTTVTGNLTITTGNGEDYVGIGDNVYIYDPIIEGGYNLYGYTEIRGNTVINTGAHDDYVHLQPFGAGAEGGGDSGDVEFGGNLAIATAGGDDYVIIGGDVDYYFLHVHGNFSLQLGAGDDDVEIENEYYETTFYNKVVINGGGGFDEITDIDEWFDDPDATFAGGIGAVKFVKIEEFND